MNFLNPIMLAGLAAVAIPIVIHLWNRNRFQVVTWAARKGITYVPRVDERTYAHQFVAR